MARIKTGRPTIVDVAELAGVSVATVSRALNGRGEVHADTRKAVNAAAERLNFAVKRRAPDQASRTIGLLTSDPGRFSMSILEGAEDALGAGKIEVLLCATRNDPIREAHYVTTLVGRDVDGIIVVGSRTNSRHPLDVVSPIPIVYAFAPSDDPRDISFAPDDIEGGRMATRHLLDLGRRHIAHITGPEEWSSSGDRAKGCLEELRSHGHELVGQVMYGSEWSQYWGRTAMSLLLRDNPRVDAVVCGNDQIATGVIDIIQASGRSVPNDVSVVGYDNWEVFALDTHPTLTSVDMGLVSLGREAALAMFDPTPGRRGIRWHPPKLVIRESSIGPLLRSGPEPVKRRA